MDVSAANRKKYLKPPPIELIEEFVKELGVSERQFERFYNLPRSIIYRIRIGDRNLGAAHWEKIYMKQKPIYGLGYQEKVKKRTSTKVSNKTTPEIDNHGRLGRLKTK